MMARTGKKSQGLSNRRLAREADNGSVAALLGFLIGLLQRGVGLFLTLLERILRTVQNIERLRDNLFDGFAALTHRVGFRFAAVIQYKSEQQKNRHSWFHGTTLPRRAQLSNSLLPISPSRTMRIVSRITSTTEEPVFEMSAPPSTKISTRPAK